MRPVAICNLLDSVVQQTLIPDEIIVVDGSLDERTKESLEFKNYHLPIMYFLVDKSLRGLTRQRNFGVGKVNPDCDIIAFLDDDIVLTDTYFEKLREPYLQSDDCMGVGGYIIENIAWRKLLPSQTVSFSEYSYDGYVKKDVGRNLLRKTFGLLSAMPPCWMPVFSHGRSLGDVPPSGKIYQVEYFMGGVASYRKKLFNRISFSEYFEGYGLYEDLDFTVRASKIGSLYVHTGAQLFHYHEPSGRPNQYLYGKMVVRNGWYVWRVRYPKPPFEGRFKWNLITLLLILIRCTNILIGPDRVKALTEVIGRTAGYFSLFFSPPKIER